MTEDDAPGWDAIDAALTRAGHLDDPTSHWSPDDPLSSPLAGLSAMRSGDHWLFVTYGLSEVFTKQTDDPTTSGWGFELTLRVAVEGDDPPVWVGNLLRRLAEVVHATGEPFGDSHRLDARGPVTGRAGDARTALAFITDPELGSIDTPNGRLTFLQVRALTGEQLAAARDSDVATVLAPLRADDPLLVHAP